MDYTKQDRQKRYILMCRFYDGKDNNPYEEKLSAHEIDKSMLPPPECMKNEYTLPKEDVARLMNASTAFHYEDIWVQERLNKYDDRERTEEYIAYGNKDFNADDGTPISLKALLWNRFYHWGGWMPDQESFRIWYRTYYASEPTNREKRAAKRRPELIARCKYYNGEEKNPWETMNSNESGVWREWYWNMEKQWVDELSMSYNTPFASHNTLKMLKVEDYFKEKGEALSLIDYIIRWHIKSAENSLQEFGHDSAIEWYENIYLKFTPKK